MRVVFIFPFCAIMLWDCWCPAQKTTNHFTIKGKIIGRDTGRIMLTYQTTTGTETTDTAMLQNGSFVFTGEVSEPTVAFLEGSHIVPPPYFNKYDPNFHRARTTILLSRKIRVLILTTSPSVIQAREMNRCWKIYRFAFRKERRPLLWA